DFLPQKACRNPESDTYGFGLSQSDRIVCHMESLTILFNIRPAERISSVLFARARAPDYNVAPTVGSFPIWRISYEAFADLLCPGTADRRLDGRPGGSRGQDP